MAGRAMSLAFLVPVYNSESTITECLQSIYDNLRPGSCPVKIYISDNHCTDGTAERIREFADRADPNRVSLIITKQRSNLGCYGNMHYLQATFDANWGYVLCADDTLHPNTLPSILAELSSVDPSVALVAFRDNTNHAERVRVENVNRSRVVSGRRGLALFLLFGCFIGGLSNICIRRTSGGPHMPVFGSSFKMAGDLNYYVDLLASGHTILLSDLETTYYRPGSPAAAAGSDSTHFPEKKAAFNKCIDSIAFNRTAKFFLQAYAHTYLYYEFYRNATNRLLFHGNSKPFQVLAANNSGGVVVTAFWCLVSFIMIPPFVRYALRTCYCKILL